MSENMFNSTFGIFLSKKTCDDNCNKKCCLKNRISTRKNDSRTNVNIYRTKLNKHRTKLNIIEQDDKLVLKMDFVCEKCKICYSARNSLWYHSKKCNGEINKDDINEKNELTLGNNLDDEKQCVLSIQQNVTPCKQNVTPLEQKVFVCNSCNKNYASRNSLWFHRKKCVTKVAETVSPNELSLEKQININEQDISVCNLSIVNPKPITLEQKIFACEHCNKTYTVRNSLWYHRKKCLNNASIGGKDETINLHLGNSVCESNNQIDTNTQNFSELLTKLVSQNNEFMQQIVELQKNSSNNSSNNSCNNSNNSINVTNNNNFNLNVFLNETCKDAINLTDFVDSLVLGINDLEETSRLGYAKGISKIFINGLNKLDVCKRPLHCSDLKRNTIYIKDDNQWTKENNDKQSLTKAIKQVSHKNIKNIFEWQKMNPSYNDSNSKQNDRYNKIICESMSGSSKEEQMDNYDKIIKNITKEIVIDKIA